MYIYNDLEQYIKSYCSSIYISSIDNLKLNKIIGFKIDCSIWLSKHILKNKELFEYVEVNFEPIGMKIDITKMENQETFIPELLKYDNIFIINRVYFFGSVCASGYSKKLIKMLKYGNMSYKLLYTCIEMAYMNRHNNIINILMYNKKFRYSEERLIRVIFESILKYSYNVKFIKSNIIKYIIIKSEIKIDFFGKLLLSRNFDLVKYISSETKNKYYIDLKYFNIKSGDIEMYKCIMYIAKNNESIPNKISLL